MKPIESDELTAARSDAPGTPGDVGLPKGTVSDKVRGIGQVCRQLFGIPDYERYLAHATARHPGEAVLSRRDFFAQAIERKYGKSGPRCC